MDGLVFGVRMTQHLSNEANGGFEVWYFFLRFSFDVVMNFVSTLGQLDL